MSISRRAVLAGVSVAGVGLLTACERAISSVGGAARTPMPSVGATGAAAAGPTGTPTASASASAVASAAPSPSASASSATAFGAATASPTPSASRSMPVPPGTTQRVAEADPASKQLMSTTGLVSGASCLGVATGQFGSWRGSTVGAAATWAADGSTWFVDPGNEYGSWQGHLDYAPQYEFKDSGSPFTWEALAAGAFDSRLVADMTLLKARWAGRKGTLFYRFQHEFNGDWYGWSVDEASTGAMVAGWRRMARIFRTVFGVDRRFQIVWGPNAGTSPAKYKDLRATWPGAEHVDVIAVDYYDFFKPQSAVAFASAIEEVDALGNPIGIAAWQRFAAEQGKPWAVSEWANQYGDNPIYIRGMHDFFQKHAYSGTGSSAGKLIYEIYFNMSFDNASLNGGGEFRVQVDGRDAGFRPSAARTYRELFSA